MSDAAGTKATSGWSTLLSFTAVAGASQMLWLNFAPLIGDVQKRYGVGELAASMLVLAFPLLYVVFSLPAGALIDRRGYKKIVAWAAVLQAVCSLARLATGSFAVLLAAQIAIAIAQPFIVNAVSKLVSDWFPETMGATATGIATVGLFVGMAVAMAATPPLVEWLGLSGAMAVFAGLSFAAALWFVLVARENGSALTTEGPPARFRDLLQRDLLLVFGLSFLGLGFFNGLTTWLEQIVAPNGIDAVRAGLLGGVMIVLGIVGAGILPPLSDKLRRRKPFVILCTLTALVGVAPFARATSFSVLLVLSGVIGFFFLPAYALLLEMCNELSGPALSGFSTGVLMLLGNAGGVVVSVAMVLVKGDGPSYAPAVWLLVGLLAVGVVLAVATRETYGGGKHA